MRRTAVLAFLCVVFVPASAFYICAIPTGNSVICDATKSPSTYTGMEVELFRYIANKSGLVESYAALSPAYHPASDMSTFTFHCSSDLYWDGMMQSLADNSTFSHCAMATGEITITPTRVQMGVRFSYPIVHTGLAIMIYSAPSVLNQWAFFSPFQAETWLAFVTTLLVVPLFVWVVEQLCMNGMIVLSYESLRDMRQAMFETMLCVFNLQIFAVKSFAAQICVLCFCFLVLIMMATYTAQLAAVLTLNSASTSISSIDDLRGLSVWAQDIYVTQLQRSYGVGATPITYNGFSTFDQAADALANGTIVAYIADAQDQEADVAQDSRSCYLSLLDELVMPHDYGFAFHTLFPAPLLSTISKNVLVAQSAGQVEELTNRFLVYNTSCSSGSSITSISFNQMAGLWIILAAGPGFGLVWALSTLVYHLQRSMRGYEESEGSLGSKHSARKSLSQALTTVFVKDRANSQPLAAGSTRSASNALHSITLSFQRRSANMAHLASQAVAESPDVSQHLIPGTSSAPVGGRHLAPNSPLANSRHNWVLPVGPEPASPRTHLLNEVGVRVSSVGDDAKPPMSVIPECSSGGRRFNEV